MLREVCRLRKGLRKFKFTSKGSVLVISRSGLIIFNLLITRDKGNLESSKREVTSYIQETLSRPIYSELKGKKNFFNYLSGKTASKVRNKLTYSQTNEK